MEVKGVSEEASGAVENIKTRGLYPVCQCQPEIRQERRRSTSPTAKNRPSGLNDTHVAALTRSRADQDLPPGDSDQSVPGDANGEAPIPASRNDAAVRFRLSFCVGVAGPPYTDADGLRGFVVGRAR